MKVVVYVDNLYYLEHHSWNITGVVRDKLLRSSIEWFFYSIVIGLIHLWVAWAIAVWTNNLIVIEQTLTDGSLLVFTIALVATSYGTNYDRIFRNHSGRLWPLFTRIVALIVLLSALVFYMLTVYPKLLNVSIQNPSWTPSLSVAFVIAAGFYGLTCHILSNM